MNTANRRLRDRVDGLEEQLDQIRGALALVDDEQLLDAVDDSDRGQQLRQVLVNIRTLAR